MSDNKGVEAVERALSILDCFEPGCEEMSLADLSRKTGLYKSTILRLAVSLERFGYLIRLEGSRFRLGSSLWRLGSLYNSSLGLEAVIRAELKCLRDATRETASFYIRQGDTRLCLYREEPERSIRHALQEGTSLPLKQGASGRLLLAFSDVPGEGDASLVETGFAISKGERDGEVASVAVPLCCKDGSLLGVLSISGLISRFDKTATKTFLASLQQSAERLSHRIAS